MTTAIHIELNVLCLLILCVITYQSVSNVNQQMHRVLFRSMVYGVIAQLALDSLWLLVEGRRFPGAILANRVLNGLNNRKTLEAAFAEYVKQGRPLYLFMMDLDRFKQINDTLSHPVGDEALVAAASILTQSMVGKKGILARYGGDEFLAMLFLADEAEADAYRQSVKAAFEAYNREHALPYRLAASVGYVKHSAGMSLEDFVNAADGELYKDKRAGK